MNKTKIAAYAALTGGIMQSMLFIAPTQQANASPGNTNYCSTEYPAAPFGNMCYEINQWGGQGKWCDPSSPVGGCPWNKPTYGPVWPSSPGLRVNPRTGTF
jgi:hypothetical protein